MKLERDEVKGLFALAKIDVLNIKPLPDGYSYSPEDPRYYETLPRCVWWFVKTPAGWVEVGWRNKVLNIDWTDTPVRKIITPDDVTKSVTHVQAYSIFKALEYLITLKEELGQGSWIPTAKKENNTEAPL